MGEPALSARQVGVLGLKPFRGFDAKYIPGSVRTLGSWAKNAARWLDAFKSEIFYARLCDVVSNIYSLPRPGERSHRATRKPDHLADVQRNADRVTRRVIALREESRQKKKIPISAVKGITTTSDLYMSLGIARAITAHRKAIIPLEEISRKMRLIQSIKKQTSTPIPLKDVPK
jgi:hypothetical protein